MLHAIKIVASVLATGIALVAYVPYLIDMFRGKNKPHLYTWISIFLVTGVVAYIQLIGGAGVGAVPTILGVGVDAVILFYCFCLPLAGAQTPAQPHERSRACAARVRATPDTHAAILTGLVDVE